MDKRVTHLIKFQIAALRSRPNLSTIQMPWLHVCLCAFFYFFFFLRLFTIHLPIGRAKNEWKTVAKCATFCSNYSIFSILRRYAHTHTILIASRTSQMAPTGFTNIHFTIKLFYIYYSHTKSILYHTITKQTISYNVV